MTDCRFTTKDKIEDKIGQSAVQFESQIDLS